MQSAQVYVNGALFDQTTANIPPSAAQAPLYLGVSNMDNAGYGTRAFFAGRIRDARVHSRQLGAAEVHEMYVNGPTLQAPSREGAGLEDAGIGFVSSALHRSLDGTKVTMYAQWRTMEDYEAMRKHPAPLPYLQEALTIAKFEPGICEVVESFLPGERTS